MDHHHDLVAPRWKAVGASVRGSGHAVDGTEGQDAHAVRAVGDWLVAVVCDGAGSAALGGLGAEVGSREVADALAASCAAAPHGPPADHQAFWHAAALDAVRRARRAVEHALLDAPGGTDDRGVPHVEKAHATLVAAAVGPAGGLFVHVGDGEALAIHEGATRARSAPANGAYANETFFFTQPDWDGHLRLTAFGPPFDTILLLSDGGAALATQRGDLHAGFYQPVSTFLAGASLDDGRAALADTLAGSAADAVTDDDRTVVWARRLDADASDA